MVPLNTVLANGDQVEIITSKQLNPSRDWLVPSLGYLASPRNRNKVRAFFRKLDEHQNTQQGRQILERELQRLAIHTVTLPELIGEFNFANADQLYRAIGEGEINVAQISGAVQRRAKPQELPTPVLEAAGGRAEEGVGHHHRWRRRPAVELRRLLQPRSTRIHRRLHHARTRRQHPSR